MKKFKTFSVSPFALVLKIAAKLSKTFGVFWFMLSAGLYTTIWNWRFVLVFMGSLMVHELGHVWAMRRYSVRVKPVQFIPFVGAIAVPEDAFPSRKAEAVIALMGPLWGGALALATFGLYHWWHDPLLAALAGWMALFNLFNLLPMVPLDGGRVLKSLMASVHNRSETWLLVGGLVACLVAAIWFRIGIFYVVLIFGTFELRHSLRERRVQRDREQIIRRLAELLDVPAQGGAVTAKIAEVRLAIVEGCVECVPAKSAAHPSMQGSLDAWKQRHQDEFFPITHPRKLLLHAIEEDFSSMLALEAQAARTPYQTLIKRKERFAIQVHELLLDPMAWDVIDKEDTVVASYASWERIYHHDKTIRLREDRSSFTKFLRHDMPALRTREGVLLFLGTAALVAILSAILFATGHVPGADAAMHLFRD